MINYEYRRQEAKKFVKFLIVGGSTFLLQSFLYWFFSRILFTSLEKLACFALAVAYGIVYNYSLHRIWTFNDQKSASGTMKRYAVVSFLAVALNNFLFWLGHNIFGVYDLIVVFLSNAVVPLFTYAAHRFFTFKESR